MSFNFDKICRICLDSNKQIFDIFTSYYSKRNILYSQMLYKCTEIKPYNGDGLPTTICKECSRQLKRAYSFNVLCVESDRKLLSILENKSENVLRYVNVNDDIKNEDKIKYDTKENLIVKEESDNTVDNILQAENKDDIKTEPDEGEDSCWDADDDNLVLHEVKLKKFIEVESNLRLKQKRERKRKTKVPESKLPHQCDICGKFLSNKSNLKAHKICHTDLRPYKCADCPATFRGYSALFQHKKVHTGETPYHCEYCPKQFSRRTGLVNHVRVHTGEKLFSCEICFKNFVQSAQLSIHMKRHKGEKPFLCQDCGKGFPIKADLKVHQRIHNGEKPYSCHLCTKTFTTSGNLSIHIRIHNKEVRYRCKECHRGFVTCSAYNVHVKRHKGQRDYQCECGKTFYTSSSLKQHKVVHTGEKKYQCKICDRKFSQTGHLSRHFKKDHARPNAPMPTSDHYKLIVPQDDGNKSVFSSMLDATKGAANDPNVKRENS